MDFQALTDQLNVRGPRTEDEAGGYRYGRSPSNPDGWAHDPLRCAAEVYRHPNRNPAGRQCRNVPGFGPDALYCRRHADAIGRGKWK